MKKVIIINISITVMLFVLSIIGGVTLYNVVRIKSVDKNNALMFNMKNSDVMRLSQNISNNGKYTISAIVEPENIVINDVNWEIAWQSSTDLLSSHYVDMKATDDILTVELTYKQNFDIPLEVTCDLLYGNGKQASATCVINCYERYSGTYEAKVSFNGIECSLDQAGNFVVDSSFDAKSLDDIAFNVPQITYDTTGTISVNKNESLYLELSEELKGFLDDNSLEYEDVQLNESSFDGLTIYEVLVYYYMPDFDSLESEYIASLNETQTWFKITKTVEGKYDDKTIWDETFSFYITGFNVEYYKTLTSFRLSETSIIF